jgi:hypothetical protein
MQMSRLNERAIRLEAVDSAVSRFRAFGDLAYHDGGEWEAMMLMWKALVMQMGRMAC